MKQEDEIKENIVGRAIVTPNEGEKKEEKIDSERNRLRRKARARVIFSVAGMGVIIVSIVVLVIIAIQNLSNMIAEDKRASEVKDTKYLPTVQIVDENGGNEVSSRVKDYVGMLEADTLEMGQEVDRVVLPEKKARELDVYLKGRTEYYKVNIDRETGVAVEDMVRMMKYLDENGITGVNYVDIRVEGKAFYK